MFNFTLWGGNGNKRPVAVTSDNEINVISAPYPPLTNQKAQPFRQYLTDTGLSTGSNDMGVDESVRLVVFAGE